MKLFQAQSFLLVPLQGNSGKCWVFGQISQKQLLRQALRLFSECDRSADADIAILRISIVGQEAAALFSVERCITKIVYLCYPWFKQWMLRAPLGEDSRYDAQLCRPTSFGEEKPRDITQILYSVIFISLPLVVGWQIGSRSFGRLHLVGLVGLQQSLFFSQTSLLHACPARQEHTAAASHS